MFISEMDQHFYQKNKETPKMWTVPLPVQETQKIQGKLLIRFHNKNMLQINALVQLKVVLLIRGCFLLQHTWGS